MSDATVLSRSTALLYLAKILPVWPADHKEVAALCLKHTGWCFAQSTKGMVYTPLSGGVFAAQKITKKDWLAAMAERYGINNDREDVDDDDEFLMANSSAIMEKGDPIDDGGQGVDLENSTMVNCPQGHVFVALPDHPVDGQNLPHCPHCMAEALAYIGGFRLGG